MKVRTRRTEQLDFPLLITRRLDGPSFKLLTLIDRDEQVDEVSIIEGAHLPSGSEQLDAVAAADGRVCQLAHLSMRAQVSACTRSLVRCEAIALPPEPSRAGRVRSVAVRIDCSKANRRAVSLALPFGFGSASIAWMQQLRASARLPLQPFGSFRARHSGLACDSGSDSAQCVFDLLRYLLSRVRLAFCSIFNCSASEVSILSVSVAGVPRIFRTRREPPRVPAAELTRKRP